MRKPAAAMMLFIIFLLPSMGGPEFNGVVPYLDQNRNRDTDFENAGWQDASSGTGAPRAVDFQGLATSSGTTVIDATHPGYIGIEPPLGWSSEQLEAELDHLSTWVDVDLVNPRLDDYHQEKFIVCIDSPGDNADNVDVPDGWTVVKTERDSQGGGRETHPEHGLFELNSQTGGYDDSRGFRFEAQWGGSDILYAGDGVYLSQQVDIPYREVYSAQIRFRYFTMGTGRISDMENQTFVFTRLADYTVKLHNFEPTDVVDTWLEGVVTIPSEAFENLPPGEASVLDIGLGTDISGAPGVAQGSFVLIDEIELRLQVRPYPEQIDLKANGARVTGSTLGSVSPYVPDGSNRDCYSDIYGNGVPPGTMGPGGIDLNGYDDDGRLDVGVDSLTDWSGAFKFQVGLQFPLNVPQGAAITSSILEIETDRDATGDPAFRIFVADEDDVAAFTQGYPLLPDLYDWVNTSIYWDPSVSGPGRYNTPDLSPLIQKVVSRPGWQSGNYICIMIDYAFSNVQMSFVEFKGSSGFPQGQLAQLNVDFIAPDSSDVIPSFRFNKDIVIDHAMVASDLQNFPVLVDIWDADLHLNAQPDGDDIAFLYNGQVISHEIDAFDKQGNGTHAHLSAWVNVPYLSSVEDTTLVMVYGDEDLGSQEKVNDVWDTDFSAVWHFGDNPAQPQWSGTYADYIPHQPQISDITSPSSDGTTYGSMTSSDLANGFIGGAIDLEGGDDYIDFGTPSELSMSSGFTVEAWFYADFIDNDYLVVKSGESNFRGWDLSFDDDSSISPAGWVTFRWSPDGISLNNVGYERVDTGLWYQVVGVFSGSEYARFYLNGELVGEMTSGIPASVNDPNRPLRIGRRSDIGGTSYFDGLVDEVRISAVARSDAWIRTQYVNQRSPELFMTVGDESVNFRYRKDITVDHTKVASDLSGFPVLIDIYDTDLRTDVQSSGDDIMFTLNGKSLSHEIELFDQTFNSSHAHLVAWVRTDLSSSSDTVISMFYGNPSMGSQENPNEVWDSRYNGVWHLGDTSGDARDSTYYGTDGTLIGNPTRGFAGQVGYAYDFDAIDDVVNFGNPADEHLDFGDNDFTVSMWINVDDTTGNWQLPLYKGGASAGVAGYDFETTTDGQYFFFYAGDGTANRETDWGCTVVFDTWIYFTGVVDRTSQTISIFKNGNEFGTPVDMTGIGSVSSDYDLVISRDQDGRRTNAMVDEVRVSSTARSAGWILTEYRNQNDPASFFSVGVEQEAIPLNQAPTGFQYQKEITINHTKVESDLAGFPVLIDVYDTDLKTDVQTDGDDIVFVKDGWLLPHEIELFEQDFNSSHAHLVAWLRTDLSSTADTVISMYYGNPTSESQDNPTGVWDASYAAVWHLSEDPSGTVFDSTTNNNDGVGRPIGSEPTLQLGKIYRCAQFYGEATNDRIEAAHSSSLMLSSDMMVEAWVRTSNSDPTSDAIVAKWGDAGHRNYWLGKLNATTMAFYVDNTQSVTAPFSLVNDGAWHHVVGIAKAGSGELSLYVDGVERSSDSYSGSTQTGTSVIHIANNPGSIGFIQEWDGRIDEVRVSRSYRSPGWILTEFNNQNDPDSFYSISDEIVPSAFGVYDYRKRITITSRSEAVSAGYSTSLTFDHATLVTDGKSQADGDDIRIAHWNGSHWNELDRVLDSDSSWNIGNTKIWFQIQSAIPASSSDDHYYVYYGDLEAEFPPDDHAQVFQFYDGFESGDLGGWDAWSEGSAGDDISAVTSPPTPNTRTYSARCEIDDVASPQAIVWENFADETSLLARTHIYLDPSFSISGGGHVTVMQFIDTSSGWQNQLSVTIRDDMTLYVWNDIAGEAYGYGITSTLSTGTWYMLEIQATISATDGEVRLWLDGNVEIDVSGKNIGTDGIDRYAAGLYWASPQTEPNIVYVDDAFLRAFVSPEPTIALGPELALSAEFNYKKDIAIDHTKVDADVADFPLLIDIYDADLKTKAQADGDDIIFKSGDLHLSHEIELYDPYFNSSHAHLVAWVKTDLSSTVDTTITMYYGNSQLTNQEDPDGVWSGDYWGVWHLGETTGDAIDSTSGGIDGTPYGSPTQGVAGSIGYACEFDGTDDYLDLLSSNTQSTGTYSFWVYPVGFPSGPNSEVNIIASVDTLNRVHIYNNRFRVETATNDEYFYYPLSYLTADSWQHIVFVRSGDFGDLYVNGVWIEQCETVGADVLTVDSIGGTDDINRMFNGSIDEARISTVALPAAWITAEYRNQNDPSSFYTVGQEVNIAGQESVFDYKKDIVVDHNQVDSDLMDFPLLIDIYDTDLRTDVQADGDDIAFVYDSTAVPYEIELFNQAHNSTHAHLVAWVKVDLSSTVDTTISMYYGNSGLSNQENPSGVWSNGYLGVWHLSEDQTGTGNANLYQDSTSSNNDGDDYVSASGKDGQVDSGQQFDGINDYVDLDSHVGDYASLSQGSISLWFRYSDTSDYKILFSASCNTDDNSDLDIMYYQPDDEFMVGIREDGGSVWIANFPGSYADGNWHHYTLSVDGSGNSHYIDGNSITCTYPYGGSASSTGFFDAVTGLNTLRIGNREDFTGHQYHFGGYIDEVRISNVPHNAGWISTGFNNQDDPASFLTVGPEVELGGQESVFDYKKDIVVDHNKVDEDLTDFPLLIDIYDTDLRTDVQADGDDIIFTMNAATLSHEIELFDQAFNSTHAHLTAWVKVDLSSTMDTTIAMYYGNPNAPNQENPADVWSNNYIGVWHLSEMSGQVSDSTSNIYDGSVTGASYTADSIIDGGYDFVRTETDYIIMPGTANALQLIDFTVQAWLKTPDSAVPDDYYIVTQSLYSATTSWALNIADDASHENEARFTTRVSNQQIVYSNSIVTGNNWNYLVGVRSNPNLIIYVNGSFANSAVDAEGGQVLQSPTNISIGSAIATTSEDFNGIIDEVRISSVARPAGWIATEFENQNDPSSFYTVGAEEETATGAEEPSEPTGPSLLDATGYQFSTSSTSSVSIGTTTSLSLTHEDYSLADDLTQGTSFSLMNGSIPIWTANVLVSPPPEIDSISFEVSYPEGEWFPVSVLNPSGEEMSFASNWTCFDGRLIVGANVVDEYGIWRIQFQDRNHVFDALMGPSGGPYSSSDEFAIGDDIEFRFWSSGTFGSSVIVDLIDSTGSTWYSGPTSFQGKRFSLPYHYRKDLTISHNDVAENLVNFPVLIDIYDTDLRTNIRADGRDIAFAIGEETLAHEIELFEPSFNLTHAHLLAWVNVPVLSGSTDTVISMYYGNPLAPIVYDSGPVWDSGYLGVWHLGESGTGTTDEYQDSSQYKHHGTGGEGNSSYVPTQVSGKIGSAQDFNNDDGYYDLVDCGDYPAWNIDGYQITLQAWVQHDITPQYHTFGIMNHKGWYDGYSLYINYGGGNTLKPTFPLPGSTHMLIGANDVTGLAWHHVVATYDGSLMRIYVDGVQDPNVLSKTDAIQPSQYEQGLWIGHGDQPKDKGWSAEYEGQIDEVRISDVARSAGWIQTEFQNQNNPSSFYSVGAEESVGYSESAAINLDSSAPAGVWRADARYLDGGSDVDHRVGIFSRNFVVERGASLSLIAPGDAVSDGISAKLIGEGLFVEYELSDLLSSAPIPGATVTMNWTVSGAPTQVQLNDYGDGRYGKVLNTTDLGTAQRWRMELTSSHQFYGDANSAFFLDLSGRTYLTYELPTATAYGDDFTLKLTLRDSFDGSLISNAGFSSNGTLVGLPVDYGNGTYLLTVDSSALSVGEHIFRFTATPADSLLLSSYIDVQFEYRPVSTEAYPVSSDSIEIPWGEQATVTIHWYDLDHSGIGIDGGTASIVPSVAIQTVDIGGGNYVLTIDTSSYLPGTYAFDVTLSKANYEDATTSVTVIVRIHSTTVSTDYSPTSPVGTSTYFDITFLDIDGGSIGIDSGNLSYVTLDWGSGPQAVFSYGFLLDTSSWSVGVYTINITVYATTGPRYYSDATISVELEIKRLEVYVSWEHLEPFPNGDDFTIFIHLNVSEPGSSIDGDPINGLTQAYFTARNETGWQYTFESFAFLGDGRYQIGIDQSNFLEGDYTIIVYVDFLPADDYLDSQTPVITFTYRPILTYLSSNDYPTVTTTYDTNVTITMNYVDIDNVANITTGVITAEGASISWQHLGDGIYEVLVIVQGWDLGSHEVNITADAPSYQAKTLTFEVLVQIAYAYARSSDSSIDLPLGDTAIFYVDYWDIIHDEPILGASIDHNWTHALIVVWTGSQYRVELPSLHTDSLGSYFILFNVSKGSNYQFGYFNVSLTLRTHYTEFRLGSAVEPTTYFGMVNVSVYYGDLDNDIGIASHYANASVYGESGWIDSTLENDTSLGDGYYIIRFNASVLGDSGIYNFTVYFNWTGPTIQFYNGMVRASVNIIGEESELSLEDSPGPTPYLENMSYTYFYGELYSGVGISNSTDDVFIFIEFVGESIDTSLVSIIEGLPGYYTLEFNSTIFGRPGVFTMIVSVNWSASVSPFYDNRTDTISVRVIPRNTVVSVTPPDSTSYGVNATFSFSFDDVSEGVPASIRDDAKMTVNVNLPDYTISYNSTTRQFHVSFNTSVLGASLGNKQFTISITWIGSPFYANITARTIFITVTNRETSFDFATPSPTPYGELATFTVTFLDMAGAVPSPINDGVIALFNDSQPIPGLYYSYLYLGNGQYSIDLDTTYFTIPDSYTLVVEITTGHFYYQDVTGSRTLNVRYRIATLTAESAGIIPYNSSVPLVLHYRDLLSLGAVGNSTFLTSIEILNGSSWLFSSGWRVGSQDYMVIVHTYNQMLDVDRDYVLWIRFTYSDVSPFYLSAETYVSFRLKERTTYIDVTESPLPTPYLDLVNFTVVYSDLDSSASIGGANIVLTIDTVDLLEGTDYILQTSGDGVYYLSVNTTAIGTPGTVKSLIVTTEWTSGAPYYTDSSITLTVSVMARPASVSFVSSPSQVRFLENITFTFSYIDDNTDDFILLTKDLVSIYSGGSLLQDNDFTMSFVGNGYEIGINSTVISPILVTNWNVTVFVNWPSAVAPYYSDDAASVGATIINRGGSISLGNAPTTPIGDNMTLTFSYEDVDTGIGIGDAIVLFDCLSPSGLIENVDFWVLRGVGFYLGEYTVLVDSNKLSGVGLYTFSLRLQWNPSQVPYYRNASEVFLIGSIRLIQSQLEYDDPTPTTVPISDNVSVVLTLTDGDHLLPIGGAENNITVTYKSDGSIPSIWSITVIAPGEYEIVVNCTDAGSGGTNALVIQIDLSIYQFAEVQVPIQIRPRHGELSKMESPDAYFGEQTYAIVELVDIDASSAPIHDAVLNLIWPETSSYVYIGNGRYNITLDTTSLDADLYTLVVSAQKADYFIPELSISIRVLRIPTGIILPQAVPDAYWGESVSIWALFNDTRSSTLISGANVVYQFGILGGSLAEGPPGNYSFTIDTGNLPFATTYLVSVTASLDNYETITGQITVNILSLDLELTIVDGLNYQEVFKGESINITVFVRDVYNDVPLTGATVTVKWLYDTIGVDLSQVPGRDGYYSRLISTADASPGTYSIAVSADKTNYITMSSSAEVKVDQIETVLDLDASTETYSSQVFNWTDTIRIGVYLLVPSMNDTGYANCTVSWSLSGTFLTGDFVNGTSVGGAGYFYFDFNAWEYNATTYTLRFTAYPLVRAFAPSSNMTTLTIKLVQTTVYSPYVAPKIWGWAGWVNLTYWNVFEDRGVVAATVGVDWNGIEYQSRYTIDGVYQVWINTSLVRPDVFPVVVSFWKQNHERGTGVFTLTVNEVPTECVAYAPAQNQIDDSVLNLRVPFGDILSITLFYNDTWNNQGIANASDLTAVILGPSIPDKDTLLMTELSFGNYSLLIDSSRWIVSDTLYRVVVNLGLDNRSRTTLNVYVTIINVPTALTANQESVPMNYGQTTTILVFYHDVWEGHNNRGIPDGSVNATSLNDAYVVARVIPAEGLDPGWYEITLISQRLQGSAVVLIELSKENYDSAVVSVAVSVEPSDFDLLLERSLIYGLPIGVICIIGAILWSRLFSLPKRLREIRGMVRDINRGRIPKIPDGVQTRREILTELFNEIVQPIGLVRSSEKMIDYSLTAEVPEVEELLIQLSILTELTPEELDEFRADVSKMKVSEQAAFIKEVIYQEAMKRSKKEKKSMEKVLEETLEQARAQIAGKGIAPVSEPVVEKDSIPEEAEPTQPDLSKAKDELPPDLVSEEEVQQIRKKLVEAGISGQELEMIMAQVQELPKELVDDLIDSILKRGGGKR